MRSLGFNLCAAESYYKCFKMGKRNDQMYFGYTGGRKEDGWWECKKLVETAWGAAGTSLLRSNYVDRGTPQMPQCAQLQGSRSGRFASPAATVRAKAEGSRMQALDT